MPKVHTNTVHTSVKKIIPKETPKSPIQCHNCTECNSTFDARHKLKNHTREQHEGKSVKYPERKSPRTETNTNLKLANTKKDFKEQVTAEGEDINVKIVTIDVTKLGKFAESSHPNRTGKQAAEK